MDDARLDALGRLLAERHAEGIEAEPDGSLLNYAESSRVGDWSMRSALVRFAQPEPARSGELLELVRRLDAVLHHVARPLEARTVRCDRDLKSGVIEEVDGLFRLADPTSPYPDTRGADLARIARAEPEGFARVLSGYASVAELDQEEQVALPLLGVALDLDDLAEDLSGWAHRSAVDPPPAAAVDATCAAVRARLDELGVPSETAPPGRGSRSRD